MLEVLELLAELIIGPILELVIGFVAKAVADAAEDSGIPWFALTMTALGGAAIGVLFSYFFGERLLPTPFPGISLLLSPLALGILMHFFGRWRQARAHDTTPLATFLGGAALGLGIAVGRLLAILG